MILTITSLKGGTGKTTLTGLAALYLSQRCQKTVLLVDLDPQAGTTALFLDRTPAGATVVDLLEAHQHGMLTAEACRAAFQPAPDASHIFVLPGDARLGQLPPEGIPQAALRVALETAAFPSDLLVLVDTGTLRALVAMGIAAADAVLVPMMLSPQTIKPTVGTLALIQRLGKPLIGLVPVGVGRAQWESDLLAGWQRTLATRFPHLQVLAADSPLLPGLPYTRQLVRGAWRAGEFPERFAPTFALLERLLLEPAARS